VVVRGADTDAGVGEGTEAGFGGGVGVGAGGATGAGDGAASGFEVEKYTISPTMSKIKNTVPPIKVDLGIAIYILKIFFCI
jgi:hypothetical protein